MDELPDHVPGESPHRIAEPRVVAIPYEDGAYWRKGAKEGPAAILSELSRLREYSLDSGRVLKDRERFIGKPYELAPYSRRRSLEAIEQGTRKMLQDGFAPVSLGGDHSITLPIVRALSKHYGPKSFGIIHIDAHSDTFDAIDGFDYHHGSVFRNVVEEGLVDAHRVYQFGLRGAVRDNGLTFADAHTIPYVLLTAFRRNGLRIAPYLSDHQLPYYVSFDIDAVDPAFAPGTGTPVPGGFSSGEALDLIRQIAQFDVIGMDIVEVAPAYDVGNVTALLAAHLLFESLACYRFCKIGVD